MSFAPVRNLLKAWLLILGFCAVLGLIATPILFVNAFSPALFALIVDQIGWNRAIYALLGSSILTWIAIELMSRWYEGTRERARLGDAAPAGRDP